MAGEGGEAGKGAKRQAASTPRRIGLTLSVGGAPYTTIDDQDSSWKRGLPGKEGSGVRPEQRRPQHLNGHRDRRRPGSEGQDGGEVELTRLRLGRGGQARCWLRMKTDASLERRGSEQ